MMLKWLGIIGVISFALMSLIWGISYEALRGRIGLSLLFGAIGVLLIMIFTMDSNLTPDGDTYMKPDSNGLRERYDNKTETTTETR